MGVGWGKGGFEAGDQRWRYDEGFVLMGWTDYG